VFQLCDSEIGEKVDRSIDYAKLVHLS
jgi:hypothetical protein